MPIMPSAPAIVIVAMPITQAGIQNPNFQTWETDKLFQYGTTLLKRGRQFENTIAALKIAVLRQPENLSYRQALGCAYAARFASVALALHNQSTYDEALKEYQERKATWEKAQTDPQNGEIGSSAPEPPVAPRTPDDGKPFTLKQETALKDLERLRGESIQQLDKSSQLAKMLPPIERAEAEYIRGWAYFLLRRFEGTVPPESNENVSKNKGETKILQQKDVINCFESGAKNAPDNVIYWRSLALAYAPEFLEPWESGLSKKYLEGNGAASDDNTKQAVSALNQALTLKPQDFDSLYQMAQLLAPVNSAEAQRYLEKATRRLGINASLWYFLAEQRFRQANQNANKPDLALEEKALSDVESGNQATQCQSIGFNLPVPPLLRAAFGFRQVFGLGDEARLAAALSTYLSRYANDQMEAGNSAAFLRAIRAMLATGLKVSGSVDLTDFNRRDAESQNVLRSRALMGVVNCYQAYSLAKKYQNSHPNSDVKQFLDENASVLDEVKKTDFQLTGSQ